GGAARSTHSFAAHGQVLRLAPQRGEHNARDAPGLAVDLLDGTVDGAFVLGRVQPGREPGVEDVGTRAAPDAVRGASES
ncbi:hypothetical protein THAOC_07701, partial [Thalassiosira oceanica]